MRAVRIFDTTLRDGEQSPGASMNVDEKIQIAKQLARLGVDVIEAGFAISSQGDFDAIKRIGDEVEGPVICSLARAKEEDIKRAWEAVRNARKKRIHTFHSTSDIHLKYQFKVSREEALKRSVEMVKLARSFLYHFPEFIRHRISYGIRDVHCSRACIYNSINYLKKITHISPCGVHRRKFNIINETPRKPYHRNRPL